MRSSYGTFGLYTLTEPRFELHVALSVAAYFWSSQAIG